MDGEDTNPRHAATPQRIRWFVPGRSPGLEVLVHRLPGGDPVAYRWTRTSLPLRGQRRNRAFWRPSPASRFTRHENHARAPRTGRSI